jgi:spore germination cell wall hydrolase CwlJ-like protein
MFLRRKMLNLAAATAALSTTLAIPASNLFAAPAPNMAAVDAAATPQLPLPAPALPAPVPEAVAAPAERALDRPAPVRAAAVNDRELDCMTRVMLYEAGNEGRAGMMAVGHVVLNRVRSPRFPDSVCSVIYQRGQFSSIRSFSHPRNARWQRAEALARDVMAGETGSNVGTALYFHATRVRPAYVQNRVRVGTVGNHVFYR